MVSPKTITSYLFKTKYYAKNQIFHLPVLRPLGQRCCPGPELHSRLHHLLFHRQDDGADPLWPCRRITYKGIPYAEAARYEEPHAPKAWQGIRSSRSYGPCCPQEFRSTWLMDNAAYSSRWDDGYPGEDCQRVNIWTPGLDGKKRPVMVWIHGGGFSTGSGQEQPAYDGNSLAKKGDVVVVSLNHRLNVLGFLNLSSFGPRYQHSANLGILDIIEALKWVKNNIANFGGDPDNITIFGQSGGGRKVSTLCCTPRAQGLFEKAIVQSGSGATFMMDSR